MAEEEEKEGRRRAESNTYSSITHYDHMPSEGEKGKRRERKERVRCSSFSITKVLSLDMSGEKEERRKEEGE